MIKKILQDTLQQIDDLLAEMSFSEYQQADKLLSGSTIGTHVRHIIEFVQCVLDAEETGRVCYDDRKRDKDLQTNIDLARRKIADLQNSLPHVNQEQSIQVVGFYGVPKEFEYYLTSSIERELAYNIEHAIHHMAMIKIAVQELFPHISVSPGFGVAHSTLRHESTQ